MLLAALFARRHGSETFETLAAPGTPAPEVKKAYKAFQGIREHPEFAEVQLWNGHEGIVAKRTLQIPARKPVAAPKRGAALKSPAPAPAPDPAPLPDPAPTPDQEDTAKENS